MQYPIPVYVGYNDVIDIQRLGNGNNVMNALFLSSSGRAITNGDTRTEASRARGVSPRSGKQMQEGRNKLPWEFDNTQSVSPVQAMHFEQIASVKGYNENGWFAIGQNDRLYYTGTQTWPAAFEQNKLQTQSSSFAQNLNRLLT